MDHWAYSLIRLTWGGCRSIELDPTSGVTTIQAAVCQLARGGTQVSVNSESLKQELHRLHEFGATFRSAEDFECYALFDLYAKYVVRCNGHLLIVDCVGFTQLWRFFVLLERAQSIKRTKVQVLALLGVPVGTSIQDSVIQLVSAAHVAIRIDDWWAACESALMHPSRSLVESFPPAVVNSMLFLLLGIKDASFSLEELRRALSARRTQVGIDSAQSSAIKRKLV